MTIRPDELFAQLGGEFFNGFPAIHAEVFHTTKGTPYLVHPGAVMIARPQVELAGMRRFLEGYGEELNFGQYLDDPDRLPPASLLSKVAGQTCYASWGRGRTMNANGRRYLDNIKEQGHGSVLEHAVVSFLLYGVSRSLTHELVRHRAGFAISQLSQRYVDGRVLRFVMRPEFAADPALRRLAEDDFDRSAELYERVAQELLALQEGGDPLLSGEAKRDRRKKVNQAAREMLPNAAETVLTWSGNMRALRHVIEMRASEHAEVSINELALRIFLCLYMHDPIMFGDYEIVSLPDGRYAVETQYRKV